MEEGPESQVSCGARQPRRWSARRPLLLTVLLCLMALVSSLLGLHLRARMHWHAAQEALAHGYLTAGRMPEAMHSLDDLLRRQPRHAQALVWRAGARGKREDWENALDDARQAVELRPEFHEARLVMARALERLGHAS